MLIDKLVRYLREMLDMPVSVQHWDKVRELPLFLQDNYVFYRTEVHGIKILLMVDSFPEKHTPAIVGKHLEKVRDEWSGDVVYVREQITSYDRKRLINAGIQFIVPGNQLYLPLLGMDLREYFLGKRTAVRTFSPAAQALTLYWIYQGGMMSLDRDTPTELAKVLGYTKMTMSRAYREVESALDVVFAADKKGKEKKASLRAQELWERLGPYLRTPVSRRHYLQKKDVPQGFGLRAGLTALADYSMLAAPSQPVHAVDKEEWKLAAQKQNVLVLDRPDDQTLEVEVWRYPPRLFAKQGMNDSVDPLSLYLSIRASNDERIEQALKTLLEGVRW